MIGEDPDTEETEVRTEGAGGTIQTQDLSRMTHQRENLEHFLRAEVYDLFARFHAYNVADFAAFKEELRDLFYHFWESREGVNGVPVQSPHVIKEDG